MTATLMTATVANSDTRVLRGYADEVFNRARVPMEPIGFAPNWTDGPSRYKTYPGTTLLPLPAGVLPTGCSADESTGWSLECLATLLRLSYGVLRRRLESNWNQDLRSRTAYPHAVWGRGTASGGGLYPLEIYLVAGPSGPLLPGVYHYATGSHGLERLVIGDVTRHVHGATRHDPATAETDQFLLVSAKFWKSAFKYNSFSYHVVTQDLGALLGTWELVCAAMGRPMHRVLWFADRALNDLLGLDTVGESVLAVVPLPWPRVAHHHAPGAHPNPSPRAVLIGPAFERSRTVIRFPQVERVHLSTIVDTEPPAPKSAVSALPSSWPTTEPIELPPPIPLAADPTTALTTRRSSFGTFVAHPSLTAAELGTVLGGAARARAYRADVRPGAPEATFTRLYVLTNRVDGLHRGGYGYDAARHAVRPIGATAEIAGDMSRFLQSRYLLTNYNLDQVGAVIAIAGRVDTVLGAFGNRGYRILNSEVGAVAQAAYLAATGAGIGCGAVLGFDNIAMNHALDLDASDERTILFLLIGHTRQVIADIDYRIF